MGNYSVTWKLFKELQTHRNLSCIHLDINKISCACKQYIILATHASHILMQWIFHTQFFFVLRKIEDEREGNGHLLHLIYNDLLIYMCLCGFSLFAFSGGGWRKFREKNSLSHFLKLFGNMFTFSPLTMSMLCSALLVDVNADSFPWFFIDSLHIEKSGDVKKIM